MERAPREQSVTKLESPHSHISRGKWPLESSQLPRVGYGHRGSQCCPASPLQVWRSGSRHFRGEMGLVKIRSLLMFPLSPTVDAQGLRPRLHPDSQCGILSWPRPPWVEWRCWGKYVCLVIWSFTLQLLGTERSSLLIAWR